MTDWLISKENCKECKSLRHTEPPLALVLTWTPKENHHTYSHPGLAFRPPWTGGPVGACAGRKLAVADAGNPSPRARGSWTCSAAALTWPREGGESCWQASPAGPYQPVQVRRAGRAAHADGAALQGKPRAVQESIKQARHNWEAIPSLPTIFL